MKKNSLIFVVLVIALFASVGMVSCSKKADESFLTPKEDVRIFMSVPPSNSGLKSGSITEKKQVQYGDTVDVKNISDVNILISAENEWNQPIDVYWSLMNVDNDRDISRFDTIAIGSGARGEVGPVLSTKLKFFGLYQVNFTSKTGVEHYFFIRHTGMPGVTGDDWDYNYNFRLDKNAYQINNQQGYEGYTLYLKYQDGDIPVINDGNEFNPSDSKNFHALVYCGGNNVFVSEGGFSYNAKEFGIKKCKYSPGYICFSFVSDFAPPVDGMYTIHLYSGKFGWNWWSFPSIMNSNWGDGNKIEFFPI